MGMIKLEIPSQGVGNDVASVQRYLFRVVEELNNALNNLSVENFTPQARTVLSAAQGVNQATEEEIEGRWNATRDLITRTATQIYESIDELEESLSGIYVAQADYDEDMEAYNVYVEKTNQRIQANSYRVEQVFSFYAQLNKDFIQSQAWIKSGFLDYDNFGYPIYGIEIGQKDDEQQANKVRITSTAVTFYTGNALVATIQNGMLYIGTAKITNALYVGNWRIDANTPMHGGFSIKWIDITGVIVHGVFTPAPSAVLSSEVPLVAGSAYTVTISGGDISEIVTMTAQRTGNLVFIGDSIDTTAAGTGEHGYTIVYDGINIQMYVPPVWREDVDLSNIPEETDRWFINGSGEWEQATNNTSGRRVRSKFIPIPAGATYVDLYRTSGYGYATLMTSNGTTNPPDFAEGWTERLRYEGDATRLEIPADAQYVWLYTHTTTTTGDLTPSGVSFFGPQTSYSTSYNLDVKKV